MQVTGIDKLAARSTFRVGRGVAAAFSLSFLLCGDLSAHVREVPSSQLGASIPDALRYAQADPDSREVEETFWDSVKESGDPDMIDAYLESYPDGKFTKQARTKLNELRGTPGLGEPVSHPFTGKWGTSTAVCRVNSFELDEMNYDDPSGGHRLVIFGAAKSAQFFGKRFYVCKSAKIAGSGKEFAFAAQCKSQTTYRPNLQVLEGQLDLQTVGQRLTGVGPDGSQLNLMACD